MARPSRPMYPSLAPEEAAADGAVSIEVACAQYLGGIGPTKFRELVAAGEIEVIHEGRRTVVPVAQLKARLARLIADQRAEPVVFATPRRDRTA